LNKPKLIVISAPSGSGKTTIASEILRRHPEIRFSVSATTRPRREHETDGRDYYFLTRIQFEEKIRNGDLVEWEEIYGCYYGTLKSVVDAALREGTTMLFDLDVKGALSIKQRYAGEALLLFIKPPSIDILTERLKGRKTESADVIKRRLERVPMEMEKAKEFDFTVINDDLTNAVREVDEIVAHALEPA
jgi:guanylate kinase